MQEDPSRVHTDDSIKINKLITSSSTVLGTTEVWDFSSTEGSSTAIKPGSLIGVYITAALVFAIFILSLICHLAQIRKCGEDYTRTAFIGLGIIAWSILVWLFAIPALLCYLCHRKCRRHPHAPRPHAAMYGAIYGQPSGPSLASVCVLNFPLPITYEEATISGRPSSSISLDIPSIDRL